MDPITRDAYAIKDALREAESNSDQMMQTLSSLKQRMLTARANPQILPHAGQSILVRVVDAEQKLLIVSNTLARVHADLTGLAEQMNVEHAPKTLTSGFNAPDNVIYEANFEQEKIAA